MNPGHRDDDPAVAVTAAQLWWTVVILSTALAAGFLVVPVWGLEPVATPWSLPPVTTLLGITFLDVTFVASHGVGIAFVVSLIRRHHRNEPDALRAAVVVVIDAGILAVAVTAVL